MELVSVNTPTNTPIGIYYPSGQTHAKQLALELAARLDELVLGATSFADHVKRGRPVGDRPAIYVGLPHDWANDPLASAVPWWRRDYDFGIRVVSGTDCINPNCTTNELHIVARDYPLLLRAVWLLLHRLGWRHYMPNGVSTLTHLWVVRNQRSTLSTQIDAIWIGAFDHLLDTIAGRTRVLSWSDGTDHGGEVEGDLAAAMGDRPMISGNPQPSWLRHMGWTTSSVLQVNNAWRALVDFDQAQPTPQMVPWDADSGTGHFTVTPAGPDGETTTESTKLYTADPMVQGAALAYAQAKLASADLDWVSLARSDKEAYWDVSFGDVDFESTLPVDRQIELANAVATNADYQGSGGAGIVIQAYGACAETPTVFPDPARVCVIVVEAYRPAGKTIQAVVEDYVGFDADGRPRARCPLGLKQFLYSDAWGAGIITASAGSPESMVEAANRLRHLPPCSPKVLTGEAMTEFGLYGLSYYCYMQMALDVGHANEDFTLATFENHARRFYKDLYPTGDVRAAVQRWYEKLLDREHKPLLSSNLLRGLWDDLSRAMAACPVGGVEQQRVAELCKFTHYLDVREAFEAAKAALGSTEAPYDEMLEWLYRIRDSGLVDVDSMFGAGLDGDSHTALGLGTVFDALNAPPGDGRGTGLDRPAWDTSVPSLEECQGLIASGITTYVTHGLTDTRFSSELRWGWHSEEDTRARLAGAKIRPYRSKGKTRLWLVPGGPTFTCTYTPTGGDAYVEFVKVSSGRVRAMFPVTAETTVTTNVDEGQLYEIRLTNYETTSMISLDWWTIDGTQTHGLTFDPGRDGDPCGFTSGDPRGYYFFVPRSLTRMHFYASEAQDLRLYYVDAALGDVEDESFSPISRLYQAHTLPRTKNRVFRIEGIQSDDNGFWLLNCPNLFALLPRELLKPVDA